MSLVLYRQCVWSVCVCLFKQKTTYEMRMSYWSSDVCSSDLHPLILGWFIACVIRVCVGSATVAGLTATGIIMPLMSRPDVNPNLMVLAIGAGSLMFSRSDGRRVGNACESTW